MTKKHINYEASDDEEEKPKNFEDILELTGGFGRFQILMLTFILFYEIPTGLIAFVPVFVGAVPPVWQCQSEDTTSYVSSKDICECNGTRSSPPFTIVSEWNLICESSWVVASITSIQMFGMLFGNTIPPQISDWYGRKITFLLLMIIMTVGESMSALAPDPYTFAVARFICGIGLAGYFSLNGIYTMEFLTPKWRQLGGCLGPLGEGVMLLGVLAYFIQPWRLLLWATTFPFVTVIFIYPFLPESPRWLLRNKRIEEAKSVLQYIARVNGAKPRGLESLKDIAEQEGGGSSQETVRYTYVDLFRRKEVRGKTLIFVGVWFCWAFTYFGLSYNIRNFGIDPYLMTILMGFADCIGFRAALLINNRLGRRKALVVVTSISAMFFLPLAFLQMFNEAATIEYQRTFIVSVLLGKVCVAAARSSIRVLTVESYPVSIRTMGFGVSRVSSTFGGMAAPQIAYLGSKWPSIPLFAFGILGFLGSLLSLLLNETSGKPLQDDMKAEEKGVGSSGKVLPGHIPNNNNNGKEEFSGEIKRKYETLEKPIVDHLAHPKNDYQRYYEPTTNNPKHVTSDSNNLYNTYYNNNESYKEKVTTQRQPRRQGKSVNYIRRPQSH